MKPVYLTLLALTVLSQAEGQDTVYFSNTDLPTIRQLAVYYRILAHTDSAVTFRDYWMNDRLKVTGAVSNDMKQRIGTFTYYDTAGVVMFRQKYVGHGGVIETDYYPDGEVRLDGPTLEGQKMGKWTSYYPSGKTKAIGYYTGDQLDTATFYNEDGSSNDSMKIFWREPGYPGGTQAWLQFLNTHLHYPDDAVNMETQGTVIVQFKVSKEGKTSEFMIIQSAGKSLDDEAIRVMQKSGNWLPAIYGGTAMDTYKTEPVVFRIENLPHQGTSTPSSDDDDFDKTFTKVEIESFFPGGQAAWLRYLNKNLQYPDEAEGDGIQGTVVVQFIVDKKGNVTDVQALSGPTSLQHEAVRLIKKSGKWTPAIQNGRQVKSYKRQPVIFKLN